MVQSHFRQTQLLLAFFVMLVTMVVLSCQTVIPTPGVTPTDTPVSLSAGQAPPATQTTIVVTGTVQATTTPGAINETDEEITLTLWTIEEFSPEAEGETGNFVSTALQAFRRANPDIKIDLIIKKLSGKGGMLDFLRTSKDVAPSIVPDVAVLDSTDLNQAYASGLIQRLDGKLDRSIVQDLLPAARRMGTIDNQLVGVPLGLEMEHTVYNTLVFESPPLLWSDVLSANTRYLFPARGVNGLVNDHTLAQYFSAGGRLVNDQGAPVIDEAVLRSVLNFYQQAVDNGTLDPLILDAATTEELWPTYVERQAGIAQITVRQYLADRELLTNTVVGPLPVQSSQNSPTLVIHTRALVLVTDSQNLRRQAAALNLIEWFMSTSNNITWNQINGSIPTRDTAFQRTANNDPYWQFLSEQLNRARAQPGFTGYDRLGRILQQAVVQVINGEATPEEATATAIDALAQ